jgi:hypothetical protein
MVAPPPNPGDSSSHANMIPDRFVAGMAADPTLPSHVLVSPSVMDPLSYQVEGGGIYNHVDNGLTGNQIKRTSRTTEKRWSGELGGGGEKSLPVTGAGYLFV